MNSQHDQVDERSSETSFEDDPRWQLVQRIIKSRHFIKSARLQEFLIYVCRCSLNGQADEISEQRIGERVFQRSPHYNSTEDNIVRSQARLLRQKLHNYFTSDGENEPLVLEIPKGGYAPEFISRTLEENRIESAVPEVSGSPANGALVRGMGIAIALLVLAVFLLLWMLLGSKEPEVLAQSPTPSLNALWSQLFTRELPTTIIVQDSTVGMVQEMTRNPVELAAYLRRSPASDDERVKELEKTMRGFSIRRYTTFDSVITAVRIAEVAQQFKARPVVRYARDMTLREFSPGNIVSIGRPVTNPWNSMFADNRNFTFYSDLERNMAICKNRSPMTGEQVDYPPIDEGPKRTVYAVVAFLPNLNDAGNVLIIEGTSSGAQEVAAEFATNEKLFSSFVQMLPQRQERLPYFEVLIRTITLAGVPQEPEVIAMRLREE